MNAIRLAASCGLTLALLPSAGPAAAQTAAPQPSSRAVQNAPAAPRALSSAETAALRALYQKLRPSTLRLEDCDPKNCSDPGGVGTGFLIGDGYALTAYHVVLGSKTLSAQTLDKKRYAVTVVGYDDQADLALLRVNVPATTPFLPLAAKGPTIGEALLGIGNGGGTFLTFKTGRLTGLNSDAGRADFPPGTMEMTAPLVPGDSGGPVINTRGEVVGVVSYIRLSPDDNDITSFAVPVTQGDPRLAEFRRGVKRDAPVIGISLRPELSIVTALPAENFAEFSKRFALDLGSTPGAFFTSVVPDSPAARAGLQPLNYDASGKRVSGDIVTAVNGERVTNFSDFQYAVRRRKPGETVTLTVLRGGKSLQIKLTLAPRTQIQG